jgi:two-component system OmpR family sensor kinase
MWSTRARLAATYAGLLFVTLIVYSTAVYLGRPPSANETLGRRALSEAQLVRQRMVATRQAGRWLTTRDSALLFFGDSGIAVRDTVACISKRECSWQLTVSPTREMIATVEPLSGFFLVLDAKQRLLYSSEAVRRLPPAEQEDLNRLAVELKPGAPAATILLPRDTVLGGSMVVIAVSDTVLLPNISLIMAGAPAADADLKPGQLLGIMFLLAPLVFLISVIAAYSVAGNTFKPVDLLINEVEAITDGRSLHRRVPEATDEELARLAETLNRMIGRLQSSFGALRRFTADASHELKTPLTVVRADVERAMHPSASGDERMEALEEAMQEIARMSDLVDSLLTLARADEGRFDLHREQIRLEPVVRDVFETAVILGEDAGVTVALPLVEDAMVMGDATRLRQLFLNLITNAIKYTPRGGHVEITLSLRNNDEVGFAVRDTGVGIAAADLEHIFDRFWRADRARSRRPAGDSRGGVDRGGFGLGLSIAQWIAQAHGGSLTAQSRLARGSIFTVLLPVASKEVGAATPADRLA